MAILQKTVSILLITTFVSGNALCLCEASAAVESSAAERHAHHAIQAGTDSTQTLISGSPIYSFVLHAPPVLGRNSPIRRFDRILA